MKHKKQDFFEHVWDIARLIPEGRVTSYGAIARALGSGRSSRIVGYAINASQIAIPPVPAHRVVNRNGLLTGKMHFATADLMQQMLEAENIEVQNNKVVRFSDLFWDPVKELGM